LAIGPRLRRIVRAPKTDIKIGPWHSGKVPRKDFPIAKKAYGLGASFRWLVISFLALDVECRVLIIFNAAKEKYEAVLGAMDSEMLHVLCSYEYHAGEPGWHCHVACDEMARVPLGYMRGPWVRRIPAAKRTHSRQDFGVRDETAALRFALDCYKIETQGTLL
jgi:hypothetical protein